MSLWLCKITTSLFLWQNKQNSGTWVLWSRKRACVRFCRCSRYRLSWGHYGMGCICIVFPANLICSVLKINQLLHKSNSEATLWDIVLFLAQIWHINNTLFYCLFLSPYLILFGVFFCGHWKRQLQLSPESSMGCLLYLEQTFRQLCKTKR